MISSTYVPRDEALEGTQRIDILMGIWKGVLHNIPSMVADLYKDNGVTRDIMDIFKFNTPKNVPWNETSYVQEYELGRQTIAGINPVSLERLKVFPPISKLDPSIYGPPESDLKEEHIICLIVE